jgi:indolepyruvate ferredoxin oxidoreductase
MNEEDSTMTLAPVALDDKYRLDRARVFLTGVQALARLPMLQRKRDRAAGLNTAGYISGYRGSPLGGLDSALSDAEPYLREHGIRFHPGVNEDLAATAIWGTQQLRLLPGAKRDGIFAMWYGKGPGVDRCGDVFKQANQAGTSRAGGVLVVAGDDHAARSSAVAHQSEHMFSACAMPVLAPSSVQEILDFGLHGWAMSRYTGLWVALKLSADVVEGSATVDVDSTRMQVKIPADFELPPDGLHIRWPDPPAAQEHRMQATKIYAAAAYARANGLDRLVWDSPRPRLGLVACGKAWLDLRQALHELGIDEAAAARLGLRVYKVGMAWPLEAEGARRFATGLEEILVIEEKRQIIEYQLKEMLYNWRDDVRPRIVGKFDESGEWPAPHHQWLLPPTGELTPLIVARAIASRLARIDPAGQWVKYADALAGGPRAAPNALLQRTPYFCPGCPHNRSTVVPEGSCAFGGVGCHLMAVGMERRTLTIAQMGGEGATWIGMAEHAGLKHMFANMGDGTYFHSGLLSIRAAVAADVNITYKILYNDAVAMTGGQPVDGPLSVPQLTRQIHAEGVKRIVVLADDPHKYPQHAGFAPGVEVLPRERLDAVQRELRNVAGVTALVYDQTCATEARRRRKRGAWPAPKRHVFINEAVCEGCGDCSVQSNCLAVVPVPTEFGIKRAIDRFTCNFDMSCLGGNCPALVTVEEVPRSQSLSRSSSLSLWERVGVRAGGATSLAQPLTPALSPEGRGSKESPHDLGVDALPEPDFPHFAEPYSILIAGVGGSGVVTLGALLGMAAHLEGRHVTVLDQTGLSQKAGAVMTHVRIAADHEALHAPRIVRADLLLGCDLLVAAGTDSVQRLRHGRTRALVNTAQAITGEFVRHPERGFPVEAALAALRGALDAPEEIDATRLATLLVGDSIASNMVMLGHAWQRGWVPLGLDALRRAIELNGVAVELNQRAFDWGRLAAVRPDRAEQQASATEVLPQARHFASSLNEVVARRRAELVSYQGEALAHRYWALVERVRRAEQQVAPGSERLALAVARQAFRLYAVKDEYEVARLFSDPEFDAALGAAFGDAWRLNFHFTLPWQRGTGGDRPRKHRFGAWIRPLLRLLALGRHVRGTLLDPLRWNAKRRGERELAAEYEASIERLLGRLHAARFEAAVAAAQWPEPVRGFGVVKQRNIELARQRRAALFAVFEADAPVAAELAHAA